MYTAKPQQAEPTTNLEQERAEAALDMPMKQSREEQDAMLGRKNKQPRPEKPALSTQPAAKMVSGYYSNNDVTILLDGLLRRSGFERIRGGNEQDIVRNMQTDANTRTMVLAPIAEDSGEAMIQLRLDIDRAYQHNIEQVLGL